MWQAYQRGRMENNAATKSLLIKMAEATLKQRFSQFARRYNQEIVGRTWAEIAKSGGIKLYLSRRHWDTPTKIADALDSLEAYCDSIEAVIRDQDKRKKGGK
jgi:hypothetical protein